MPSFRRLPIFSQWSCTEAVVDDVEHG